MQSAGKSHHAPDVSTISKKEDLMSDGEPPQGDNPPTFTAESEEVRSSSTRNQFNCNRNFSGMSLGDLYIIEFVLVQQGFPESLMNVVSGRWPSTTQLREHVDFQFAFLI
jgi:hypothetical protein